MNGECPGRHDYGGSAPQHLGESIAAPARNDTRQRVYGLAGIITPAANLAELVAVS